MEAYAQGIRLLGQKHEDDERQQEILVHLLNNTSLVRCWDVCVHECVQVVVVRIAVQLSHM